MSSRRRFLARGLTLGAIAAPAPPHSAASLETHETERITLDGEWMFRTDPEDAGERQNWQTANTSSESWRTVIVPHTWQIEAPLTEYRGVAWYRREFDTPSAAAGSAVRIEFEAIFHSAKIWINGKPVGEHLRKGYTAFTCNADGLLSAGHPNVLTVRVDNSFNEHMLPRGRSSDWAHDGGIYRPVSLLVTPKAFIERVDVDALPDLTTGDAQLEIAVYARNRSERAWQGAISLRVVDDASGLSVLEHANAGTISMRAGDAGTAHLTAELKKPHLWHFDAPRLYRLEVTLGEHRFGTTFGVRKFEVKDAGFYWNGERVWLMGVERMAGSNPEFGMAEPAAWIAHDHDDLKHLNCVFTRVHWQQDRRVLDYCDRHGILIQTEVPTWGPNTFKGMGDEPDADILENGREQLREMIARDRNHPSICSWGLCNEIGGQNPPAYHFAQHMLEESKRLDPHRLCSYASHSLRSTPAKDVSGLMDFIECNEYFGSWYPGDAAAVGRSLDEVHAAFPDKPIVISEYGYCACTAERPEGDERRREILRSHDAAFRQRDYIAGLIFFCYNDYRTHIGDRGRDVLRQRVHGVVDVWGNRKPSYDLLREESSPIAELRIEGRPTAFKITVRTRLHVPAYTLRGYRLRGVYFGYGQIPIEQQETALPELKPGSEAALEIHFADAQPEKIQFDVLRPTGFSAYTRLWKS
ncbi:MAG TPA: glycoside hydrolase family 2 TIM barrel-domain containing protein [Bryobacteraceae bacterium]